MKWRVLFFALLISSLTVAQKGTVTGTLTDKNMNNEPLAFANAVIKGSAIGTMTDENGNYTLAVTPGNHILVFSFLGYETLEFPITVKAGEKLTVNKSLGSDGVQLQDVVIQAPVSREKESALLLEQQKAVEIKQQIGAQELSRKGVGDVASAVAKTSGVSKQEGSNNVYVRGLGDRYNTTFMNGLPVPSNDPEKKNIALDIFSTDIVEYISIDKVYNAKMLGDFAGGSVDIVSKNYKGNSLLEFSLGSKINSNAIEKNGSFLLQDGPSHWGYSSYGIPNNPTGSFSFTNSLAPKNETPFGANLGIKAGKSYSIGNEGTLNLFATAGFDNGYEFREGINQNVSAQGARIKSFHQEKYSYKTNTTGMFNANYRMNNNHKFMYNTLYINSSDQTRDIYDGFIRDIAEDDNGLVQRGTYIQNSLFINQLLGNHQLTDKTRLDWAASYNSVKGNMPDRTQNTLKYDDDLSGYILAQNTITDNHRYFQKLKETETAANIALTHTLNEKGKITLGYNGRFKKRDFEAVQFNFRISAAQLRTVLNPNNLNTFFNQQNYSNGLFAIETFTGTRVTPQIYSGEQNIHAGFANIEYKLSDKLIGILGVRYESIEQLVNWRTQLDASGGNNTFQRNEFLPSIVLKYELNDQQNLRFGASKTYTLPQFKERALFIYEDVTENKRGNPYLYPSQNYNADLKWELFPKNEEVISITAFGKYILDPINETIIASATNDISWVNIGDSGYAYGLEVEVRKNLFDFDTDFTNKLSAGMNISYMKTHQEIDREKINKETQGTINVNITDNTSSFTGASDLLLNADISYTKNWNKETGITATLAYSYYSDRLYALGIETKGNLVDKGMGTLDFILKTKINKNLSIDLGARNLLNPMFKRVQENASGHVDALTYKKGVVLGIGMNYQF